MRLMDILSEERVTTQLTAATKEEALSALATLFTSDDSSLDAPAVYEVLSERERLASTGIGSGVAIPHGRIKGLKAPMAALFQLAQPIGFDAPDEQPGNLLIFLLVPGAATQKHLEILSEIAELLSDAPLRERIKGSVDAAQLHQLIAGWQSAQPQ